jgi:hypothetical protein
MKTRQLFLSFPTSRWERNPLKLRFIDTEVNEVRRRVSIKCGRKGSQEIYSEKMLLQKIECIHNNPMRRGYVDEPKHWRYSSARDYEGFKGLIEVKTDWGNG